MKNSVNIGLFGFGVVGEGLFQLIRNNKITKTDIKKVCVKQKDKDRSIDSSLLTVNAENVIRDNDIGLIVELINDEQEAYHIVKSALLSGKNVVSGNKKMLANHLDEFIALQDTYDSALLYDASSCGSIPVIRNLEEYYDNDLLRSITGILNGSSNYILSRIFSFGDDYNSALRKAQELGYAETDPSSDVDGLDALYKLILITCHGFGTYVAPQEVFTYGISRLSSSDINYAKEKGLKIKLIARVHKTSENTFIMFVMPKLVSPEEYIYNVEEEKNGVIIEGECYDKQFMFGKGAGAFPTASSVLSDITALSYNYKYEYKKRNYFQKVDYVPDSELEIYLRYRRIADFNAFDFDHISESYSSEGFNYVIGKIKLKALLNLRESLKQMDVFIAYTGN